MSLFELVEEFQQIMKNTANLVEETKAHVQQIPDISLSEAPAKLNTIFDLCTEGINAFQKASAKAEEIQKTLGR
jgi:hypothetical protein